MHYLERELHDLLAGDAGIFEFLAAGSLDGVWYWDLTDPEHEWLSPRFWEVLGYDPTEREHRASEWQDLIHPDDLATAIANLEAHSADPHHPYDQLVRYRHAQGHTVWVRCRGLAIRDDEGRPVRMLGAHNELTMLKQAEAELQARTAELEASSGRLRSIFDHSAIAAAVVLVDPGRVGSLVDANESFEAMWDRRVDHLSDVLDPASAADVADRLAGLAGADPTPLDLECPTRHEPPRWVRLVAAPVPMTDDATPPSAVVQLQDVTQRRRALERLEHLSTHDHLTGLANRVGFVAQLQQALATMDRSGGHLGVVLVDLDDFKVVNEALGHDVGDRLLLDVAERLRQVVRAGDLVARFGGDEFAVLRLDLALEAVAAHDELDALAHQVLDSVTATITLDDTTTQLSASVGARLAGGAATAGVIIADADTAMYRAKLRGRRQVVHHDPEQRQAVDDRLRLEHELRHALHHGELEVDYQPVVELETGQVVGAEALVRWNHPDLGRLSPDRFIPLAEQTGLVVPLGEVVALHACVALATRPGWDAPGFRVAINVASAQLGRGDLAGTLSRLLDGHGLRPEQLAVELTETVLVEATDHTRHQLDALDRAGIAIGIDDFGTGFGSLTYLHRYPISFLKIDRSFVAGLGDHDDDTAIVTALVDLGRTLGLGVVAEGVEHPHQAQLLRQLGCGLAQGYYFGRPGPATEVLPEAGVH